MSFDHKAFAFEWSSFQVEMAGPLVKALRTGDPSGLERLIDANPLAFSSPYNGKPLDSHWRTSLEVGGLQETADFALTKYYDPADDHGLHEEWADIESGLPEVGKLALLGTAFGEGKCVFDPGLMGSYFQSQEQVRRSLSTLRALEAKDLEAYVRFLAVTANDAKGVYVTF